MESNNVYFMRYRNADLALDTCYRAQELCEKYNKVPTKKELIELLETLDYDVITDKSNYIIVKRDYYKSTLVKEVHYR